MPGRWPGTSPEPYNVPARQVAVTPVGNLVPGTEYILKLGGGPIAGPYYPVGTQVVIPMGGAEGAWDQWNIGFKRAYGLMYWLSNQGIEVKWLLGYRGGSFMIDLDEDLMRQLGAMRTGGAASSARRGAASPTPSSSVGEIRDRRGRPPSRSRPRRRSSSSACRAWPSSPRSRTP
jgi:hypothetical protein